MLLDVLLFVSRWSRGSLSVPSACCGLSWPKLVSHYVMRESRGIILGMPVESESNYVLFRNNASTEIPARLSSLELSSGDDDFDAVVNEDRT